MMKFVNCRFKFKCDERWQALTRTDDPLVRYCGFCETDVHMVQTDQELAWAIRKDYCVAIQAPQQPTKEKRFELMVGRPGPWLFGRSSFEEE
jgi:hypothetical protein